MRSVSSWPTMAMGQFIENITKHVKAFNAWSIHSVSVKSVGNISDVEKDFNMYKALDCMNCKNHC